jgi:gamma-glutamyltranspeptidase/glutathione hydrolase
MVIYLAEHNEDVTIDYRETARARPWSDIFLTDGSPISPNRAIALAIGVPGTVPGSLSRSTIQLGPVSLADPVKPGLALAADGTGS